jgi:hypothetical protein
MLATNPYQISRYDEGPANTAQILSNVIGFFPTDFASSQHIFHEFMTPAHHFTQSMPLDRFDWQIEATTGQIAVSLNATLEFAIEFFVECKCQ